MLHHALFFALVVAKPLNWISMGMWHHAYGLARPGQVHPHFVVSKKVGASAIHSLIIFGVNYTSTSVIAIQVR